MEDLVNELRAAGYSEELIAKELKYMERVALENSRLHNDKAWNYGIMGPETLEEGAH